MKTAISIPDDVFHKAEQHARRTKKSRSELYGDAISEYLSRHAPDAVTETRELIAQGRQSRKRRKFMRIEDFQSVAAGRSKQGQLAPVSMRHDEVLAEIYGDFPKKKNK